MITLLCNGGYCSPMCYWARFNLATPIKFSLTLIYTLSSPLMATPVVEFQAWKSKLDKLFLKKILKLRWSTCKVIIHKLRSIRGISSRAIHLLAYLKLTINFLRKNLSFGFTFILCNFLVWTLQYFLKQLAH